MHQIETFSLPGGYEWSVDLNWGCNLFSWIHNGKPVIYTPADYPEAAWKITGGGNPILFPSVGRTWDHSSGEPVQGHYRIYGTDKDYLMPSHSILYLCSWQRTALVKTDHDISVEYTAVIPKKVTEDNYPFKLSFIQRYTFSQDGVGLEAVIKNTGDTPAPFAFGYHPYFCISNPDRQGVEVHLPCKHRLLLTEDTVLPTGETQPFDGIIKLEKDIYYDQAFGNPTGDVMSIIDHQSRRKIDVEYGEGFELFFVYSPDGSEFVCIEPWSRGLGAFEHISEKGWQNGERIPMIDPGKRMSFKARFGVSDV